MIIYDLYCDNNHRFEGWFGSAADYESQQERHLVSCPQCDSHVVRRVPSAIAIGSHQPEPRATTQANSTAMMPAGPQVMALYQQLVNTMVSNCEDVGEAFAEEARKIHYSEAPERAIRGHATEEECEALKDEGITVMRLPSIKGEDLN